MVVVAVLAVRPLVAPGWLVAALSGAVSLGMLAGAATGWVLVLRSTGRDRRPGIARPLLVAGPAAVAAGAVVAWLSRRLAEVGLVPAVLGAVGCALGATLLYVGLVFLLDRDLLRTVWALRRAGSRPAEAGR